MDYNFAHEIAEFKKLSLEFSGFLSKVHYENIFEIVKELNSLIIYSKKHHCSFYLLNEGNLDFAAINHIILKMPKLDPTVKHIVDHLIISLNRIYKMRKHAQINKIELSHQIFL